MREEKIGFGIVVRMIVSLLPILFGMSPVAAMLCAYSLTMSFIVFGPLTSFVSSLCAVCISMFFSGMTFGEGAKIAGLFLALEAILCSAGCIYAIAKKKNFFFGVGLASTGYLIPLFMSYRYTAAAEGMSVAQYVTESVVTVFKAESELIIRQAPQGINTEVFEQITNLLRSVTGFLIPAMMIIVSVLAGYVVMWAVCAQMRKVNFPVRHSFSQIRIPILMVVAFAAALTLSILNVNADVSVVCINICAVLLMFFFVAGMSFIDFYLQKAKRKMFIRWLIHLALIMTGISALTTSPFINLFTGYILIAIVDSFADFRKLSRLSTKRGDKSETEERKD